MRRGKQPAVGSALWSALAKESSAGAVMVLDKSPNIRAPALHLCPIVRSVYLVIPPELAQGCKALTACKTTIGTDL